eukprot:3092129-Amphidinium_carterae.1
MRHDSLRTTKLVRFSAPTTNYDVSHSGALQTNPGMANQVVIKRQATLRRCTDSEPQWGRVGAEGDAK